MLAVHHWPELWQTRLATHWETHLDEILIAIRMSAIVARFSSMAFVCSMYAVLHKAAASLSLFAASENESCMWTTVGAVGAKLGMPVQQARSRGPDRWPRGLISPLPA